MALGTALAIAGGAKALGSFAARQAALKRRKKFGETGVGQELARQKKEGMFSPKARGLITGSANRGSAAVAESGKSSFAGRMAAQGLEGSVAAQRGLSDFDRQRQSDVARTAERVELANEQSKVDAAMTFAERKLADEREREAIRAENMQGLIEGLSPIATAGVEDYFAAKTRSEQVDRLRGLDKDTRKQVLINMKDVIPMDVLLEVLG